MPRQAAAAVAVSNVLWYGRKDTLRAAVAVSNVLWYGRKDTLRQLNSPCRHPSPPAQLLGRPRYSPTQKRRSWTQGGRRRSPGPSRSNSPRVRSRSSRPRSRMPAPEPSGTLRARRRHCELPMTAHRRPGQSRRVEAAPTPVLLRGGDGSPARKRTWSCAGSKESGGMDGSASRGTEGREGCTG